VALFGCIVAPLGEDFFAVLCLANFLRNIQRTHNTQNIGFFLAGTPHFALPQFPARVDCGRGVFYRCHVPAARALLDFLLPLSIWSVSALRDSGAASSRTEISPDPSDCKDLPTLATPEQTVHDHSLRCPVQRNTFDLEHSNIHSPATPPIIAIMGDKQAENIVDSPLEVDTFSESQDKQTPFSPSPARRRPSSESLPFYFHHRGPTSPVSSAAATSPGSDLSPLPPDGCDIVYPIRSVVSISRPPPGPGSPAPDVHWSACSSDVGEGSSDARSGSQPRARKTSTIASPDRRSSITSPVGGKGGSGNSSGIPTSKQSLQRSTTRECEAGEKILCSASESSDKSLRYGTPTGGSDDGYVTARFKHLVTDEGHMVVTGVSGGESIQRCEDEPIHIPGAVQGFGALIALKEDVEGRLGIEIVSEVCTFPSIHPCRQYDHQKSESFGCRILSK